MSEGISFSVGRAWWLFVLYGVIGIIFGITAIVQPAAAGVAIAWAAGVMAIAEAVVSLLALFNSKTAMSKGWLAFYALSSLVFGVLAIMNPVATAAVLVIMLAAWLIVGGVYRIVFAIRVRKAIEGEWMIALSGLLAVVLGVMFMLNPLVGIVVTSFWIGVLAVVYGVMQIMAGLGLRKMGRTASAH
jgi:uncharacterized membrane protein HdeD (DUF308 family)